MKNILLIDDNEDFRENAREILGNAGYDVWDAPTPDDAFPILQRESFDLILCDLHLPFAGGNKGEQYVTSYEVGVKTVHELAWVYPSVPIVALSNTPRSTLQRIAKYIDPIPAVVKPLHAAELVELVDELVQLDSAAEIQ